ncbi:MAG: KH domain-containing protein [Nanoarchaeota archaeon]
MKRLMIDKTSRITKNKKKLEETLNAAISTKDKEVFIEATPEDEYVAEKVVEALNFGFPFAVALTLREDALFETMSIKDHTTKKDFARIRARIIGKNGKTLRALSELTKCHFELKGNVVGIIGEPEYIKNAQTSVISLIKGSKQANVYAYLEKHQVQPIIDLGLKEMGKKK